MRAPSTIYKTLVGTFLGLLFGLNLTAITLGFEDWPLTPAPMFAHYISDETPRYAFEIMGTHADSSVRRLSHGSVGAHWSLMRFFFKYVYGSARAEQVFSEYDHDNPEAFAERMSSFFAAYLKQYHEHQTGLKTTLQRIDLYVRVLPDGDKRLIGSFSTETNSFVHTWRQDVQ